MASRSTSQSSGIATVVHRPAHTTAGPSKASQYFGDHLRSFTPRKVEDESVTDSGYGSQDSSQVATPDRLGASESGSLPKDRGIELQLSKTKTLIAFNTGINELYTTRFYSIQPTIESLLLQYVKRKSFLRSSGRHKPMVIRLLLLGNTELDAKPHIVVFCAPEMRKRVQHFFDTNEIVKAHYKPEEKTLPSFDVAVCGCAPQLRNGEICIEVFCDSTADDNLAGGFSYKTTLDSTFCGTPVHIQANDKTRNATLGGLVKLEYANGESKLCGLIAGHVGRECLQNTDEQSLSGEGHDLDDSGSVDSYISNSDSDWSKSDSEGTLEEELGSQAGTKGADGADNDSNSWAFKHPQVLGGVLLQGDDKKQPPKASLDWALVNMKEFKPNLLPAFMFRDNLDQWSAGITQWRMQPPASSKSLSEERVVLMCGSSGPKFGHLASQPARILVDPGDSFADAYMVILDEGDVLVDGDSGSWVVTADTHQVIGHVVATDPLGAGYIIPLCDIFDDIQKSLDVFAVSLPSVKDVEAAGSRTEQEMAHDKQPQDHRTRDADRPLRDSIKANARARSASPILTTNSLLPTPEDNTVKWAPIAQGLVPARRSAIVPMPPRSINPSKSRQGGEKQYNSSGTGIHGRGIINVSSRRREERERITIREEREDEPWESTEIDIGDILAGPQIQRAPFIPPAARRPRFAGSHSKDDTMSHDSGYSSHSGSSSNSPNYMDYDPTGDTTDVSSSRPRALRPRVPIVIDERPRVPIVIDERPRVPIVIDERHRVPIVIDERPRITSEMMRRDHMHARILAANLEIAARPPVPLPPVPRRTQGSVAIEAPEKRGEMGKFERALQEVAQRMRMEEYERKTKTKGISKTIQEEEGEEGKEEREEEARRQRLMDRLASNRPTTVGPGSRRNWVLDDDGVYRWNNS